jgi:outer membrane protein assembly factor BamB
MCLDNSGKGVTLYKGRLYYCTSMPGSGFSAAQYPLDLSKNIVCIDAKTGGYLWGDLIPGGTIKTFPVVSQGKAYVVTHNRLRIYNAYTGELLWEDETVKNTGAGLNYADEKMFVYMNQGTKPYWSTLIAISTD